MYTHTHIRTDTQARLHTCKHNAHTHLHALQITVGEWEARQQQHKNKAEMSESSLDLVRNASFMPPSYINTASQPQTSTTPRTPKHTNTEAGTNRISLATTSIKISLQEWKLLQESRHPKNTTGQAEGRGGDGVWEREGKKGRGEGGGERGRIAGDDSCPPSVVSIPSVVSNLC